MTATISDWVRAYLVACASRRLASGTIRAATEKLGVFGAWCDANGVSEPAAISPDVLRRFVLYLQTERGNSAGGQHAYYRTVRAWLYWWRDEVEPAGWRNPFSVVKAPRVVHEPLDPITPAEVRQLLAAAGRGPYAVRDRAIISTLFDTGVRAAELAALDLEDVDTVSGRVLVRAGKGGCSRTVWLGQQARRAMRRWLERRPAVASTAVFLSQYGSRFTYKGLRAVAERLGTVAGVPSARQLHGFRRGFALACWRSGMDLLTVSRLLGHRDLETTQIYLAVTDDDLRQQHGRLSPLDHL